jgi:hypothetical protein
VNPWDLSASDLLIWGIVLHLIADWPLQNDWMANNKMRRRVRRIRHGDGIMTPPRPYQPSERWWDRHPAAYVHAGIHTLFLSLVFGWPAIFLGLVHLLIDTRLPVVWWSKLIKQTQPEGDYALVGQDPLREDPEGEHRFLVTSVPLYDIGLEVRFWTDQVFHIICIAAAALVVTA